MTLDVRLAQVRFGILDDMRCKNIIPTVHVVLFKVAELFNAEFITNDNCMQHERFGCCRVRW